MHRFADSTYSPAAWFLVGPTAVGKTAVAQYLAERTGAVILSVDAMLVYRGMDIGTAKPALAERGQVRYVGLDVAEPDEPFSTGAWMHRVRAQLADVRDLPCVQPRTLAGGGLIAAGGTGLYVRALTQGLDTPAADPARRIYWQERLAREGLPVLWRELVARAPQAADLPVDPDNARRVIRALEHLDHHGALPDGWRTTPRSRLVGLHLPRAALHARIAKRVERMFAAGFIEEVQALRARWCAWGDNSHTSGSVRMASRTVSPVDRHASAHDAASRNEATRQALPRQGLPFTSAHAIGYAEVCDLLDNRLTREQAIEQIATRTRQLAKRQETWFRHQAEVTWIEITPDEPVAEMAARVLTAWREHGPTPIRLS